MDMVQLYFGIKCFAAVFVLLFPLISYLVEKIKDMKKIIITSSLVHSKTLFLLVSLDVEINPRFYRGREKSGATTRSASLMRAEKKLAKIKPPRIIAVVWRPHC